MTRNRTTAQLKRYFEALRCIVNDDTLLTSDTDRALDDVSADEYGFNEIARKLAPSLVDAANSDGMVIGIEGP
ncbi:hypothetical protein [Sinorhizobium meliloti]|uniref:hypothetical protein n=1 Tax=Rhizobium meliloti TaxID=382 RepID=UPI001F3B1338|nr:hypothetical protein [Sinorhizobium meliloti]